jgi:hypothetical protein
MFGAGEEPCERFQTLKGRSEAFHKKETRGIDCHPIRVEYLFALFPWVKTHGY